LLGLNLVTGRKHQIRCHLSQYLLNPIINDELYLGRKSHSELNAGIYLHSFALNITKPEIIEGVFGFRDPKKGIIVENERGSMEMRDKALLILGKLPKIW
jgi:23S rRNA-/tRNA-specific pseudouridylate synthase